jgi:hypothetical protein
MAVHAKTINWHVDSWHACHKCVDGHQWVLRVTLSDHSYWWEVRRGRPQSGSKAEVMGTGSSKTQRAAKLMAIYRMHRLADDFLHRSVDDAAERVYADSLEALR